MLEINNIDTFYGDSQALWDVSLEVADNEFVGLLGRNGAGKSTTLRSISGIQSARNGEILFEGEAITREKIPKISRKGIKLVPEERRPIASLTVHENLRLSRDTTYGETWTIDQAYDEFQRLDDRRNQKANRLSGGEQQMLVIAMALVANPKLILLDEPMEGLAPQIVDQIIEILKRIKSSGISVILVGQNINIIKNLTDRVYVMHKGKIQYSGNIEEFNKAYDDLKRYLSV